MHKYMYIFLQKITPFRLDIFRSERHFLFVERLEALSCTEKQRDAPHACDTNEGIDDARNYRILASADPRDYIESEKTDASPVQSAYDRKNKRDSV